MALFGSWRDPPIKGVSWQFFLQMCQTREGNVQRGLTFFDAVRSLQAAFDRGSLVAVEPDDRKPYATAWQGSILFQAASMGHHACLEAWLFALYAVLY